MRAHQPGSTPIDIPETVPNPAYPPAPTPAPAPERAPTKVPEKVPEKVIAPANHRHDGDCPIPTGEKVPGAWRHLADQSSHKKHRHAAWLRPHAEMFQDYSGAPALSRYT